MKKLCSVICAASVALSLAVPAFATEQTSILGSTPGEVAVVEELLKNPEATATPAPSEATPGEVETSEEAGNTAEITESVEINETNFPDPIFRQYVADNFDTDKNGVLSQEEIARVTDISVGGQYDNPSELKSLKGIEFFQNLQKLDCHSTQVSELDVSKNVNLQNLNCYNAQKITKLDVSKNIALESLSCSNTQISQLDVSKNVALESLSCDNTQISELDVSKNVALESLSCSNTQISELDISNNINLQVLFCQYTPISELNVDNNVNLTNLDCFNTKISKLDVSKNVALINLLCSDTQISELDVSNNTKLKVLSCGNTQIQSLDVSNNLQLERLSCIETGINQLDISKNVKLLILDVTNTELTELNVANNPELLWIYCTGTVISKLDLYNNTKLTELECSDTKISQIDLTQNHDLIALGHDALAVNLQGEYNALSRLGSANKTYIVEGDIFSIKEKAPMFDAANVKDMRISNGAIWNPETGAIENVQNGNTEVSYKYATNGTCNGEPVVIEISFTLQKGEVPIPTATPAPTGAPVPTATPAPTGAPVPTATPAPTGAPVPTATPVPGTPGEITGDKADQLLKDPSNTQLANEIVTQINYERYMNVTSKVATAVANAIRYNPMNLGASKDGIQFGATLHKDNTGFVLVPESAAIEGNRAQVSLHFEDGKGNVVQPKLGGLVTVKIAGKTMPAGDYVLVGEGNRMIDSVTVTTVGNDTVISFWAPHFSTYAIVPRSAYVAPSDNNNGGGTVGNPIKATGLDMSMALMGVVAMAGVAVVGGAAVAKKAKKD